MSFRWRATKAMRAFPVRDPSIHPCAAHEVGRTKHRREADAGTQHRLEFPGLARGQIRSMRMRPAEEAPPGFAGLSKPRNAALEPFQATVMIQLPDQTSDRSTGSASPMLSHPADPIGHEHVDVATRLLTACGHDHPREEISIPDVVLLAGAVLAAARGKDDLQNRMRAWVVACFGKDIADDTTERSHRMLEESIELHQSGGRTREEAHLLVDYVYNRPVGDFEQEVGGVVLTLAALCAARDVSFIDAGEAELQRVWGKIDAIRVKQAQKVKDSPLPTGQADALHRRGSIDADEAPGGARLPCGGTT